MQPHTKEKISVYKEYLTGYLSVMCNQSYWDIAVWEPFAGEGIYDDGEKGSAMVAAETINEFKKSSKKNIRLLLNEYDPEKHQQLVKSMECYSHFVQIFQKDAKNFLDGISKFLSDRRQRKTHSLIFIDPYGYTQYKKDNLVHLLSLKRIDYLIFMPTSHIYRFHSCEGPARQFILNLGVNQISLDESEYHTFSAKLLANLKEIAGSDFGYSYKLENRDASSTHHLFFITKNIAGAIQFLKAKNKLKDKLQLTLFDFDATVIERKLSGLLREPISNTKLLEEIVKRGYLPVEINPVLRQMEGERKLKISCISNHSRRKSAYYLEDKTDKITICLNHE